MTVIIRLAALLFLLFPAMLPAQPCHAARPAMSPMAMHGHAHQPELPMGGPGCLMCGLAAGDTVPQSAAAIPKIVPMSVPNAVQLKRLDGIVLGVAHPPPWRG